MVLGIHLATGMHMQDVKRLKVGAICGNSPTGTLSIELVDFDGGPFDLSAKRTDYSLVLVDPNRPSGYGVEIGGRPEQLRQFANALMAIARNAPDGEAAPDGDGSE